MRRMRIVMVVAALIARASVAQCAWTVNAEGTCVQEWAPADMMRGPTAIINAPLLPFRTTAGGAEYAWNKKEWRWWHTFLLGSAVTGAYFHLAPENATNLSVQPELSTVISDKPPPVPDRCGRAVVAAK